MEEVEEIRRFIRLIREEKGSFEIAWNNIELFLNECEKRLDEVENKL